MPQVFRPSGGLLYHLRALRSRARWRGFSSELEKWLNRWRKPGGTLVLIGPSGGYTLPESWLAGFEIVHAYDIDPLAPWFFGLRHKNVNVEFHREDIFWREQKLSTAAIETCLQAHPRAAFLFCNVLGQLPLENPLRDGDLARYLLQLRTSLQKVTWASYHDLYTLEPLPSTYHLKVGNFFRGGGDIAQGVAGVETMAIVDHTIQGDWGNGLHRERLAWPLTAQSLHLIEALNS
jgi:hypothetical protein